MFNKIHQFIIDKLQIKSLQTDAQLIAEAEAIIAKHKKHKQELNEAPWPFPSGVVKKQQPKIKPKKKIVA